MPKELLERCQPDSIREFSGAARRRFDDGLALAAMGRRTAAIYVWGYSAEMILKAAYFKLVGLGEADPITWGTHLLPAINKGKSLGIIWPSTGQGHNVRAWAELLISERASSPATTFTSQMSGIVQFQSQRIFRLWRETLRYHRNVAYHYEMMHVREATEWFLVNAHML